MQYMLLCCIDEKTWHGLPTGERDQVMKEYDEFVQGIVRSGHYRSGGRLDEVATATTLRERNGRVVTTDGPFAETKEQLGGYHLIECRDLDEALAIARRIPTLRVGAAIEVRPQRPALGG
jgi:hypothetical protein